MRRVHVFLSKNGHENLINQEAGSLNLIEFQSIRLRMFNLLN